MVVTSSIPGRVSRCTPSDWRTGSEGLSSHSVDIGRTYLVGMAVAEIKRNRRPERRLRRPALR